MRITYIINSRIPTEKAHGYQISKMCETFAAQKIEVELVLPDRGNEIREDVFSYYSLKRNFTVTYLPRSDVPSFLKKIPVLAFYLQALRFLLALRLKEFPRDAVIVTRNPEIAWRYGKRGHKVFFDAHRFPERKKTPFLFFLKRSSGIIANSKGTEHSFRSAGFSSVVHAPNGVDLSSFETLPETGSKPEWWPQGRVALYVGHLYAWKGVDTIIAAARKASDPDLTFLCIGGTDNDITRYRQATKGMKNIRFMGQYPKKNVPSFLRSADVLLLPNVPITEESRSYTSPIKMFEYMASGVPIVASDLPSIREVLNETNATLVKPGDPDALREGIARALLSGRPQALQAQKDVRAYTWDTRAENVLRFMRGVYENKG